MVAVVADPDEKASANLACSRAATACSKLYLEASQERKVPESSLDLPVGIRTPRVFVFANRFPHSILCKGGREGDLNEYT